MTEENIKQFNLLINQSTIWLNKSCLELQSKVDYLKTAQLLITRAIKLVEQSF
jgi:hypothetical protein